MAKQAVAYSLPTAEVERFRRFVAYYNARALPANPRTKASLVTVVDEPAPPLAARPPGRVDLQLQFASAAEAFTFGLSWQQESVSEVFALHLTPADAALLKTRLAALRLEPSAAGLLEVSGEVALPFEPELVSIELRASSTPLVFLVGYAFGRAMPPGTPESPVVSESERLHHKLCALLGQANGQPESPPG